VGLFDAAGEVLVKEALPGLLRKLFGPWEYRVTDSVTLREQHTVTIEVVKTMPSPSRLMPATVKIVLDGREIFVRQYNDTVKEWPLNFEYSIENRKFVVVIEHEPVIADDGRKGVRTDKFLVKARGPLD